MQEELLQANCPSSHGLTVVFTFTISEILVSPLNGSKSQKIHAPPDRLKTTFSFLRSGALRRFARFLLVGKHVFLSSKSLWFCGHVHSDSPPSTFQTHKCEHPPLFNRHLFCRPAIESESDHNTEQIEVDENWSFAMTA